MSKKLDKKERKKIKQFRSLRKNKRSITGDDSKGDAADNSQRQTKLTKRVIMILVCLFGLTNLSYADNLQDIYGSTCYILTKAKDEGTNRIRTKQFSGTFFRETSETYDILTCAHGLDNAVSDIVDVICYWEGRMSKDIHAKIKWKILATSDEKDVAILTVNKGEFERIQYKPPVCVAIDETYNFLNTTNPMTRTHIPIASCGSPQGKWPTLFLGQVFVVHSNTFRFSPMPLTGRSGSGIFTYNQDKAKLVGMIVKYNGERKYGIAIKSSSIYQTIKGK